MSFCVKLISRIKRRGIVLFGYVKPLTGELKVKELELYKATYCGLCKKGGQKVSRFTRFLLSYDFASLAVLRAALGNEKPRVERKRCPYGLKKKNMLCCDEVFEYTAAAFGVLSYCKAEDDVKDSKGLKKLLKRCALPVFKRMKNRGLKLYPRIYDGIKAPLDKLSLLESDGKPHIIDETADAFAKVLEFIASYGLEGENARIAAEAGYHIGRFIYIIDAADDLKEDREKKEFNALASHFGSYDEAEKAMEEVRETLLMSMLSFGRAVAKIESSPDRCFTEILENIAFYGGNNVISKIFNKYGYIRKE